VAAGCPHPEGVPGLLDGDALPGRDQEVRDLRRVAAGCLGRDQVGVGVAGAGAEGLRPDDVETAIDRLVRRGHGRQPRAGTALGHGNGIEGALGRPGEHPVAHLEIALRYAECPGQLVRGARECSGHRGVHVVDQRGRAAALGQRHRHLDVAGEVRTGATQRGRRHQPHQPALPQAREVLDREGSVPVVPVGPLGEIRRQRPGRHQRLRRRPGRGRHRRHPRSFTPTPWNSPAVLLVRSMRTTVRRPSSQPR